MSRNSVSALAILSMDCTTMFCQELWIPPHVDAWRRSALRLPLSAYINEPYQLMTKAGEVRARVYHELREHGQYELWASVCRWTDLVYGNWGSRPVESDWLYILAGIEHGPQEGLPPDLRQRLVHIHQEYDAAIAQLSLRLESIELVPLSSWDAIIQSQLELETVHLQTKIEALVSANHLIRSWNNHGRFELGELVVIHQWGRTQMLKIYGPQYEVSFPGAWEYGLVSAEGRLPETL